MFQRHLIEKSTVTSSGVCTSSINVGQIAWCTPVLGLSYLLISPIVSLSASNEIRFSLSNTFKRSLSLVARSIEISSDLSMLADLALAMALSNAFRYLYAYADFKSRQTKFSSNVNFTCILTNR